MRYLKEARKAKGLTQKELGEIVGCSDAAISQYEYGSRSPDYEMLLKLSEALDCTVDYLLRGEDKKMPTANDDDGLDNELQELLSKLPPDKVLQLVAFAKFLARGEEG